MKLTAAVVLSACLIATSEAATVTRVENCGWLIEHGDTLSEQPTPLLKPRDPGPIPSPPLHTAAVYCDREALTSEHGDERITEMQLPLVIRQGGRIGVIDYPPKVVLNYHWANGKFVPGPDTVKP